MSNSNIVVLLNGDSVDGSGNFADGSIYQHPIINNGTVALNTTEKKFGTGSIDLSSLNSYISVADTLEVKLLNSDFTMEGWFYPNTTSGTQTLFGKWDPTTNDQLNGFRLYYYFGGMQMQIYKDDSPLLSNSIGPALSATTWTHVSLNKHNGTIYLYIDGTLVYTSPNFTGTVFNDTTAPLVIGGPAGNTSFNGLIDDVVIAKGIALRTENFTLPTSAFALSNALNIPQRFKIKQIHPNTEMTPAGIEVWAEAVDNDLTSYFHENIWTDLTTIFDGYEYTDLTKPAGFGFIKATSFDIVENARFNGRYTIYSKTNISDNHGVEFIPSPVDMFVGNSTLLRVNEFLWSTDNSTLMTDGYVTNVSTIVYDINGSIVTLNEDGAITVGSLALSGSDRSVKDLELKYNLLKLLSNNSSAASPINPVSGQLWFKSDTTEFLWWDSVNSIWVSLGSGGGDPTVLIEAHNVDTSAHADIRTELGNKADLDVPNNFTRTQASGINLLGNISGTVAIDASISNSVKATLTGDVTLTVPTNPRPGQSLIIQLIQDATGSRLVTWNSIFKWTNGIPPTLSTAPNSIDLISCYYDSDGDYWLCSFAIKNAE